MRRGGARHQAVAPLGAETLHARDMRWWQVAVQLGGGIALVQGLAACAKPAVQEPTPRLALTCTSGACDEGGGLAWLQHDGARTLYKGGSRLRQVRG